MYLIEQYDQTISDILKDRPTIESFDTNDLKNAQNSLNEISSELQNNQLG